MAETIIGVGDPKAVIKWSAALFLEKSRNSYWDQRFMGVGPEAETPFQMLTDLEKSKGDTIKFDLLAEFRQQPTESPAKLKGKEENMDFFTDSLSINQMRGGWNLGDTMSRKRTIHELRPLAKRGGGKWWARAKDELYFMYVSGARGINPGFLYPLNYPGFAGNAFQAPDSDHIVYGGAATSKASMVAGDTMTLSLIDKLVAKAKMMNELSNDPTPPMQPIMIDGEKHYVLILDPWSEYNLKTEAGSRTWTEVQKAAAGAEGRKSPIFKGALGMHAGVVLHSHEAVIRFNDYGSGSNIEAARCLFMGAQAGVVAYGSKATQGGRKAPKSKILWREETDDRGDEIIISSGSIFGVKKTRFKSKDFGVIAVDVAAKAP